MYDPLIKDDSSVSTDLETVTKDADCLVLVTDHNMFKNINPNNITNMRTKNLVDTRNILNHYDWKKAGFDVNVLGK